MISCFARHAKIKIVHLNLVSGTWLDWKRQKEEDIDCEDMMESLCALRSLQYLCIDLRGCKGRAINIGSSLLKVI